MEKIAEFLNIRKTFFLTIIGAVEGISGRLIFFSTSPLYGLEIIRLLFPPTVTNLLLINTGESHILLFL